MISIVMVMGWMIEIPVLVYYHPLCDCLCRNSVISRMYILNSMIMYSTFSDKFLGSFYDAHIFSDQFMEFVETCLNKYPEKVSINNLFKSQTLYCLFFSGFLIRNLYEVAVEGLRVDTTVGQNLVVRRGRRTTDCR